MFSFCWLSVKAVSQLSFFSAESVPPAVADLTGVLAASGQVVIVGDGARLSVVVEELWRAAALADMMTAAGLKAEITRTDEETPLVRTAVDSRLLVIAADWTRGCDNGTPGLTTRPWERSSKAGACPASAALTRFS